jgi:hypothetical protein
LAKWLSTKEMKKFLLWKIMNFIDSQVHPKAETEQEDPPCSESDPDLSLQCASSVLKKEPNTKIGELSPAITNSTNRRE